MRLFAVAICLVCSACSLIPSRSTVSADKWAQAYFEVYAQRSDFDRFMNFYAPDAAVTDIIYGNEVIGRDNIRKFFDWGRGEFSPINPGPILEVQSQEVSGTTVVTRGVFKEFVYGGNKMGPWEFLIWQQFNDVGQITRQEDWINYTPKKILIGE